MGAEDSERGTSRSSLNPSRSMRKRWNQRKPKLLDSHTTNSLYDLIAAIYILVVCMYVSNNLTIISTQDIYIYILRITVGIPGLRL